MKKIILLISAIALSHNIFAQTSEREFRVDFQLVQHIGLNNWSNVGYVNDGLPGTNIMEIRGVFNLYMIGRRFGAFADMGVGIMPAPRMRSFDPGRMPVPHSGTQYYLREIVSESGGSSATAQFKMTFGLFGRMTVNEKLSVRPYVGAGFLTMPQRQYDVILKEEGSNMQYDAVFAWNFRNRDQFENKTPSALGYLNGRINFNYRLSSRSSLLLGLEYTWFLNSIDFYGKFTNSFNANVWRDFGVKGNKISMLGLSLGISFM